MLILEIAYILDILNSIYSRCSTKLPTVGKCVEHTICLLFGMLNRYNLLHGKCQTFMCEYVDVVEILPFVELCKIYSLLIYLFT